jgi:protein AFG1
MMRLFQKYSKGHLVETKRIELLGRYLELEQCANGVLFTSFSKLCGEPLSAADYLQIASKFDVVIIKNIPKLGLSQRNEARRFITLLDALYDAKVKLIASFEGKIEDLFNVKAIKPSLASLEMIQELDLVGAETSIFTGEEEIFAFKRAASRLIEMQGEAVFGANVVLSSAKAINPLRRIDLNHLSALKYQAFAKDFCLCNDCQVILCTL